MKVDKNGFEVKFATSWITKFGTKRNVKPDLTPLTNFHNHPLHPATINPEMRILENFVLKNVLSALWDAINTNILKAHFGMWNYPAWKVGLLFKKNDSAVNRARLPAKINCEPHFPFLQEIWLNDRLY